MIPYSRVPLGDICQINPRPRGRDCSKDTMVSFVPMAAVDSQTGYVSDHQERRFDEVSRGYRVFENGDVLFAKITPCMENGKAFMARNLTNGIGYGSTEFYVLRPGRHVVGDYIYHVVRQARFRQAARRSFTGTAGQQRVPKAFMENVLVALPPLDRQRQIVDILNRTKKVEQLLVRARRRQAEFIPALFVKIFGDPASNPTGWPVAAIGEICEVVGGGTPRRCNEAYFGGSVSWATPTDVTALDNLSIRLTAETITEDGLQMSSARLVPAGTVLLTSRATIGHTAIAAVEMATNQGFANLICGSRLRPEYLAIWLRLRRSWLIQLAGGTTFKEISKKNLKEVNIPLPPIEIQTQFSKLINQIYTLRRISNSGMMCNLNLISALTCRFLDGGA